MDASDLEKEPSFAVVCSFFNKFGVMLGLKPYPFPKLESLLTTFDEDGRVDKELIDLLVRLLRRVQIKSASRIRWENALLKFCSLVPSLENEYFQLERFGYAHSSLAIKLRILKVLCEKQFDFNPKFKEALMTSLSSSELRLLPVGVDNAGQAYWYQQDADLNLRIYSEEPDDQSGGTWTLKAKTRDDLAGLIAKLTGGSPPVVETTNGSTSVSDESDKEENKIEVKKELPEQSTVKTETPESCNSAVKEENEVKPIENGEPSKTEETETELKIKNKKGTFLDTFQKKAPKPKIKPRTEEIKEEDENQGEKSDDSQPDIPEELKPFIECRITPRRSARQACKLSLKEVESGSNSANEPEEEKETEKSENDSDSSAVEGSVDSDGSEYEPLSAIRTRSGVPRHRRRRKPKLEQSSDDDEGEEVVKKERKKATNDTLCMKCSKSANPEVLLLCDQCDDAWHTWCLRPQLWYVPDEDWYCPKCQHKMLVDKLSTALTALDEQLKKKHVEDRKKKTAADRLKREMEFIGVSLNNVIPAPDQSHDDSDSESDQSETERRRAKKKKVKKEKILPIALARTRREHKFVDYNFKDFDEMIQESIEEIQEAPSKPQYRDPVRPQGGAGRGKDMANILQAEANRETKDKVDTLVEEGNTEEVETAGARVGKPPSALMGKKQRQKLTDLDVENMPESDTDEYHVSEESEGEQSDDDDEYIPEDELPTRRSRRLQAKRSQSDEDFVVSGSGSDSERPKRARPQKKIKKRRRRNSSSSGSEDSLVENAKKARWQSGESSSEDEYRPNKKKGKKKQLVFGRRTRGRRIDYKQEEGGSDSETSEAEKETKIEKRPVGALTRPKRKIVSESSDDLEEEEWKPEAEESGSETSKKDEESNAEIGKPNESSDDNEKKPKSSPSSKSKPKNRIESSSDEDEEAKKEHSDSPQSAPKEQSPESESTEQTPSQEIKENSPKTQIEEQTKELQPECSVSRQPVIQPLPRPVPSYVTMGSPSSTPPHAMSPYQPSPPPMSLPAYHPMQPAPPVFQPRYPAYMPPATYSQLMPTVYTPLAPVRPELTAPMYVVPSNGNIFANLQPAPAEQQNGESLSDVLSSAMQDQY